MKGFAIGIAIGMAAGIAWMICAIGKDLSEFPPFYGE